MTRDAVDSSIERGSNSLVDFCQNIGKSFKEFNDDSASTTSSPSLNDNDTSNKNSKISNSGNNANNNSSNTNERKKKKTTKKKKKSNSNTGVNISSPVNSEYSFHKRVRAVSLSEDRKVQQQPYPCKIKQNTKITPNLTAIHTRSVPIYPNNISNNENRRNSISSPSCFSRDLSLSRSYTSSPYSIPSGSRTPTPTLASQTNPQNPVCFNGNLIRNDNRDQLNTINNNNNFQDNTSLPQVNSLPFFSYMNRPDLIQSHQSQSQSQHLEEAQMNLQFNIQQQQQQQHSNGQQPTLDPCDDNDSTFSNFSNYNLAIQRTHSENYVSTLNNDHYPSQNNDNHHRNENSFNLSSLSDRQLDIQSHNQYHQGAHQILNQQHQQLQLGHNNQHFQPQTLLNQQQQLQNERSQNQNQAQQPQIQRHDIINENEVHSVHTPTNFQTVGLLESFDELNIFKGNDDKVSLNSFDDNFNIHLNHSNDDNNMNSQNHLHHNNGNRINREIQHNGNNNDKFCKIKPRPLKRAPQLNSLKLNEIKIPNQNDNNRKNNLEIPNSNNVNSVTDKNCNNNNNNSMNQNDNNHKFPKSDNLSNLLSDLENKDANSFFIETFGNFENSNGDNNNNNANILHLSRNDTNADIKNDNNISHPSVVAVSTTNNLDNGEHYGQNFSGEVHNSPSNNEINNSQNDSHLSNFVQEVTKTRSKSVDFSILNHAIQESNGISKNHISNSNNNQNFPAPFHHRHSLHNNHLFSEQDLQLDFTLNSDNNSDSECGNNGVSLFDDFKISQSQEQQLFNMDPTTQSLVNDIVQIGKADHNDHGNGNGDNIGPEKTDFVFAEFGNFLEEAFSPNFGQEGSLNILNNESLMLDLGNTVGNTTEPEDNNNNDSSLNICINNSTNENDFYVGNLNHSLNDLNNPKPDLLNPGSSGYFHTIHSAASPRNLPFFFNNSLISEY
eukprot:Awhi_evm1s10059